MMTQKVPQPTEYAPYFAKYVELVPDGDFLDTLVTQLHDFKALLLPLSEKDGEFRYAPDKWTIKETLGHINDAERIFTYRILRFARADETPLPSFDQDTYIAPGNFNTRKMPDLLDEFTAIRQSTTALIRSLDDAAWYRGGIASGKHITVLALAFVAVGHVQHHQRIFQERYLPALRPA